MLIGIKSKIAISNQFLSQFRQHQNYIFVNFRKLFLVHNMLANKINNNQHRYKRPPLPYLQTSNIQIQSKQMILYQHQKITSSDDVTITGFIPKSSETISLYRNILKKNYSIKNTKQKPQNIDSSCSINTRQSSEDKKSKSRISTSFSQLSIMKKTLRQPSISSNYSIKQSPKTDDLIKKQNLQSQNNIRINQNAKNTLSIASQTTISPYQIQNNEQLQLNRYYPKNLTSKGWILYDNNSKKIIIEKGSNVKRQMASLTKIMTCIVAIEFYQKNNIDPKKLKLKITQKASKIQGTSAKLQAGHILTLHDLLHGMMLPSGNDAALTLAQYIGTLLIRFSQDKTYKDFNADNIYDPDFLYKQLKNTKLCLRMFINQMNQKRNQIGMAKSHYGNPHGLSQRNNYSTCQNLARLCEYAIKNKKFLQIVTCKKYTTQCQLSKTLYLWQNTHRLLQQGWGGIKTGVTPAAGPCLASYYRGCGINRKDKYLNIIIILLGCQTMELRYQQTKKILQYAQNL